ncbi:U3 small nucleolar RNA-associated protein 14 [Spatholobus suberectus]|nr:U3 small nucleolar RNA-associated protein 14 [Spatholobus suberectus]
MGEKKRKERDEGNRRRQKSKRNPDTQRKKRGPRLPSSLQKQLDRLNPTTSFDTIDSDDDIDVYEYEEERAEEESTKNKRYDPASVDDDLSQEIEDENVQSDDESEDDDYTGTKRNENAMSDDSGKEDDGRHARMLQAITGMPSEAFEENKKKKKMMKDTVIPELYPESEYNPSRDVVDGDGRITIEDLLNPLREKPGYGKLRKRTQQIEKNARTIHAPLSKAVQAKIERKAAYEISKKGVTKWQHIIQRNREAPTIFFDENVDLGFSTVGAIASEFEPRTEFEKKIAALVHDDKVMEAHKKDGSKLLEMNKVSIEDEKDRQNRIAKMRSLLFRHEMKAKHIKKIKSRTFHRLLKKDRLKAEASQIQMDPEAAKEYAMKQERQRAEERMTLKHKNQNRWAKRILQRRLNRQDEGTRAAINEQLQRHTELTRKMHSMKGSSSSSEHTSDEDEDEDDENSAGSDQDRAYKLLGKAKEKTKKVLEEVDEVPKSGLLSLPFMRRGLEKRKEAAIEEANFAFQEYEDSLKKLENCGGSEDPKAASTSGRRVFGTAKAQISDANNKVKLDNFYGGSDSEDDLGTSKNGNIENEGSDLLHKDVNNDLVVIEDDTDTHQESVFKNIDEIIKNPGPKTTYEVSIFVSDTWKKAKNQNEDTTIKKSSPKLTRPVRRDIKYTEKEFGEDSDTDSEGQMVDGILSSVSKVPYELPSQEDLIRHAFAGDDVEDDFEKDKQEILNEENPEPEKPLLLPGWGQWTHIQQKKGLPSWMLKKHEDAQKKRAEVLKKRKDAQLKNVIISEKIDKKAEKLHTKSLPYPFTSKEVFEQSMRVPIGPEFNPATAIGPLNRPEVVKRPGIIIKPIEFEEVNPHDKSEQRGRDKQKFKKNKGNGGNPIKKAKVGGKS